MVGDVGPETVVHPRLDVRVRRVDGAFLVGLADEAFSLSESTAFIWRKVDGRRTVAEISELLAAEYDIDFDTALTDTAAILGELTALGLMRAGRNGSAAPGKQA